MHKHTITFEDFNGAQRTKDLYFNLSEAELTKIQKDSARGVQVEMQEAIDSGDTKKLLDFFEMLVHKSYGIKSDDGMLFDKSPEIMRQFENSAYYSPLYMSFFEEEGNVGSRFINAVMPAKLIAKAEANLRGEGDPRYTAPDGSDLKPDARTIFEQRRSELRDHLPAKQNPPLPYQAPIVPTTPQYVPQNQPEYPSVEPKTAHTLAPEQDAGYQQYLAQQQASEAPSNGTHSLHETNVSRPPHESGPGFEVTPSTNP